jgi:glycosyltransferase involved in cell wall biosynthesis
MLSGRVNEQQPTPPVNRSQSRATSGRRPIRVLHIIDKLGVGGSSIHGITRVLGWWIPRFDPQQFQISVCSLRAPEPAGDVLRNEGIPVFFLSQGKFDPRTVTSLLRLIARERPDVLHLHGFGATNFGRIASLLTRIPNIVHEHVVFLKQPMYQSIADMLLAPLTTKAIAISNPVRDYMIRDRRVKQGNLETFFYGLPLADFQASDLSVLQAKRAELGIAPTDHVVCNVGRLDTQKGQIYLIRAAAAILRAVPNTRILIVGDGPDLGMLRATAQQEGVADNVIFAGYRSDVADMLALSDVVAIPSLWEGGPITLFEAMQLRKPVIGTPAGMMGEVIREGKTGFVVPLEEVAGLADKAIALLKDPAAARAMGEQGWQVCQDYDISRSVERLSAIYQELAV